MSSIINKFNNGIKKLSTTGFFHIFGSSVINKILSFISSVFIVRLITKNEYGIYTTALNHLSLFLIVSGMGMISAVLQLCSEQAQHNEKNKELYEYGASIGTRFNFLLGIVIMFFALFTKSSVEGSNELLLLLAFIPFFEVINEFQKVYFRSRLDNRHFAMSNSVGAFLVVVFSVSGAFFGGVKGLIIGRYIAAITIALVTDRVMGAPIAIKRYNKDIEDKKILYKIALTSVANGGISELMSLMDILIIGEVLGVAESVADYKIAVVIPTALMFIPTAINIYVYPYFSMNKDNGIWLNKYYKLLIFVMGGINCIITLVLLFFAPLVIKVVFGAQYLSAVSMFRISAINYFFAGTFRIISGNLLITQRKYKFNFYASLLSGILNLISNYVLIKSYGAIGAACTTLAISFVTGIIYTGYYYYLIKKK